MRQTGDTGLAARGMTGSVAKTKLVNAPGSSAERSSVVLVEVMHWPVPVTDAEAVSRRNRRADPGLGIAYGDLDVLALGEARRDRRRQRASGAMCVLRRNTGRR